MNDRTRLQIVCLITNTIKLGIFALLSILFNHWWLIFFSVLFWGSVKSEKE